MQFMPNKNMGYDRAITVFSPDGRLLQVEYAKKAVRLGSLALGITSKEGVIILADRHRTNKLLIPRSVNKIFKIEDNICLTSAGFISDARVITKRARVKAQQHKVTYGEQVDTHNLVRHIADVEQAYTQYGGIRPFGISLLIGGVRNGNSSLYLIEPSGIYFEYKAKAVGMNSDEADKILEKKYKKNMNKKDALKLGVSVIKKVLKKEFSIDRLEVAAITKQGVKKINKKELNKIK